MSVLVSIQNASKMEKIPTADQIQDWVTAALVEKLQDSELSLRIVDEDEGRTLNHTWRNKDYATNVLSFPVGEPVAQVPGLLGDMVICAPVAEREAQEQGKSLDAHWAHLIVHGMLHLQGYDHTQDTEAKKMESLEITILEKIGYANPYATPLES